MSAISCNQNVFGQNQTLPPLAQAYLDNNYAEFSRLLDEGENPYIKVFRCPLIELAYATDPTPDKLFLNRLLKIKDIQTESFKVFRKNDRRLATWRLREKVAQERVTQEKVQAEVSVAKRLQTKNSLGTVARRSLEFFASPVPRLTLPGSSSSPPSSPSSSTSSSTTSSPTSDMAQKLENLVLSRNSGGSGGRSSPLKITSSPQRSRPSAI